MPVEVVPDCGLVDAIDSYYMYVRTRLQQAIVKTPDGTTVTGTYLARGLVMALDWPPKNVEENRFYLLTMQDNPIGRQGYSAAMPMIIHNVIWKAIVIGDELTQGERAENRGTRFRTLWGMKEALRQAVFPNFTEKLSFSLVNGVWTGVSKNPIEYITWTPPVVKEMQAQDAGAVELSAMTRIWDMSDQILS